MDWLLLAACNTFFLESCLLIDRLSYCATRQGIDQCIATCCAILKQTDFRSLSNQQIPETDYWFLTIIRKYWSRIRKYWFLHQYLNINRYCNILQYVRVLTYCATLAQTDLRSLSSIYIYVCIWLYSSIIKIYSSKCICFIMALPYQLGCIPFMNGIVFQIISNIRMTVFQFNQDSFLQVFQFNAFLQVYICLIMALNSHELLARLYSSIIKIYSSECICFIMALYSCHC